MVTLRLTYVSGFSSIYSQTGLPGVYVTPPILSYHSGNSMLFLHHSVNSAIFLYYLVNFKIIAVFVVI